MQFSRSFEILIALACVLGLFSASCARRRKYENPITKDTQQPDKVLFDKAIKDIERSRFEVARLTLNTLMNTYDTSEYMAKAKLAVADSWYREGDTPRIGAGGSGVQGFHSVLSRHGRVGRSAGKSLRDPLQADGKAGPGPEARLARRRRMQAGADQVPQQQVRSVAQQQRLREIQEVLAQHEYVAGAFYHHKSSFPAASNRLQYLVDQYPLFSRGRRGADEARRFLRKDGPALSRQERRRLHPRREGLSA